MKSSTGLPSTGNFEYLSSFLSVAESEILWNYLEQIDDLRQMFQVQLPNGKVYRQNYGKLMLITDEMQKKNVFSEAAWGKTMTWPPEMQFLQKRVETHMNEVFDVGVCIYYPDGHSGLAFHSDLPAFGDTTLIPSISLGQERLFLLRNKKTESMYSLILENGSLLLMGNGSQELYEHSLPTNPTYTKPRVNITFRKYGFR